MPVGRPFQKGVSGNPGGRPKKALSLTNSLREYMTGKTKGRKRQVVLMEKLWELVEAGDFAAIRYVFDRIDGLPTARHEMNPDQVRDAARRMAEDAGLNADDVIRTAEAMLRGEET